MKAMSGAACAAGLVLCLLSSGCSDGGDHRKADCAAITAALRAPSRTDDVREIIGALRMVRPRLKDDHLTKEVDVVLDVGDKLDESGGTDDAHLLSDTEAIRFAQATDEITRTCGAPAP